MRTVLAIVTLALLAAAQDPKAPPPKTEAAKTETKKPAPLPPGQIKVLKAVVMEVKGTAQSRPSPKDKWSKLKVNDTLGAGAVIRTGRKSHVALRVGMNATVLVERQTRIKLPEIVQDGQVLRTRLKMSFGKADVRVDRIGLRNDFEVATPTATLAVRGTVFRITWDVVEGFKSVGVPGNKLRAIEVRYLGGVQAYLSKADATSTLYQLPAIESFYDTYVLPLVGAVGESELDDPTQSPPDYAENPHSATQLDAGNKQRGSKPGATGQPTGNQQQKKGK